MLEARVHEQLRTFLRQQGGASWLHHLTMARLVARALRLERSALIQVGSTAQYQGHHRLSYLMSLLMWPEPAILVLPEAVQQRVRLVDIPRLQLWMAGTKPIQWGDAWPDPAFSGLLLTSPEAWLSDRLGTQTRFPAGVPVIIDGVDNLESWIRQSLTVSLGAEEWEALMQAFPQQQEAIREARVSLTHAIFQHPRNPYGCHLVDAAEKAHLKQLWQQLEPHQSCLPSSWRHFWHHLDSPDYLMWATLDRERGQWRLFGGPADVAGAMACLWPQQPLVLIGGALDMDSQAIAYRQRLGLGDMTCLKFGPDRQVDSIQLYLPDGLPLPNTAQFQPVLMAELAQLIVRGDVQSGPIVILVGDTPLKAQVGSMLAAQFGSRIRVESCDLPDNGVLVTGWEFWRHCQHQLPAPQLLAIATLPIPSLEDPLVAGRVAYYKRRRQDWFRLYLLPTALNELQQAIAPVRGEQGTVALLDNRVNHRSYGRQILAALSPAARIRQLEPVWLGSGDSYYSPHS